MSTETDERLLKFATALGDALFDFSIAIGRAVDIIRPEIASEVSRGGTDNSCKRGNLTCHTCRYGEPCGDDDCVICCAPEVSRDISPKPVATMSEFPTRCTRPECRRCNP